MFSNMNKLTKYFHCWYGILPVEEKMCFKSEINYPCQDSNQSRQLVHECLIIF